tara:strand:- start:267 stop:431 length:165 start_codon:yes stop_codon:yes gene_type:complete
MWFIAVTSSFLWINHLKYETEEQCLHFAKKIESIDMGPHDAARKSLKAECVKRD